MKYLMILLSIVALLLLGCSNNEVNPVSNQLNKQDPEGNLLKSSKNFQAHLNGGAELSPVNTNAQGEAIFRLSKDGNSIYYKLIISNIENVLMAHIHIGTADVNGPVTVWLYPSSAPPQLIPGRSDGVLAEGTITNADLGGPLEGMTLNDLLNTIESGNTYVNVHTTQNPGGEIRGQIK